MPKESSPEPTDLSTLTPVGPVDWRRSDCCFAKVKQRVKTVQKNTDAKAAHQDEDGNAHWVAAHFECTKCGKECATYTNSLLAGLMAEREGKTVQED